MKLNNITIVDFSLLLNPFGGFLPTKFILGGPRFSG
jgi:hypothetical protein